MVLKNKTNSRVKLICPDCHIERIVWKSEFIRYKNKNGLCNKCAVKRENTSRNGKNPYAWKGGENKDNYGYLKVRIRKGNPFLEMAQWNGYVLKHRYLMAKSLGRVLARKECVHHKNGNILDNRIENLEIITSSEHCGHHNGLRHLMNG